MKEYEYLDELISRYPVLAPVKADIRTAYETLKECYERGGKLLIAGNGGSCADSEHIVRSEERRVGKECRSRWSPYH